MLEMSKVHTGPSIQSNVTHVEGVKRSSICTIRAVMLFMLKVSKVAQPTLRAVMLMYVKGVKRTYTHFYS